MPRSLYQCANARVKNGEIYCAAGQKLDKGTKTGNMNMIRLIRGAPLELKICQICANYDEMGGPVEEEDRGWQYSHLHPDRELPPKTSAETCR